MTRASCWVLGAKCGAKCLGLRAVLGAVYGAA